MNVIKLADIAREVNVRPETARAKVRRLYRDEKKAKRLPKAVAQWVFKERDKDRVKEILIGA
jgi:hypothetical protein